MLNEKLEYKEYTCDLTDPESGVKRIKYGTLYKGDSERKEGPNGVEGGPGFGGLERILTIIARYFLYYYDDTVDKVDRDAAFAAMSSWLGFSIRNYKNIDKARMEEIKRIKGWFPRYLKDVLMKKYIDKLRKENLGDNEKIENLIVSLERAGSAEELREAAELLRNGIETEWNRKSIGNPENSICNLAEKYEMLKGERSVVFYLKITATCFESGLSDRNNANTLRLEKVVANAIRRKKLREFYLACKNNNLDAVDFNGVSRKKYVSERKDSLLRFMAAYLIEDFYINQAANDLMASADKDVYDTKGPLRYVPFDKPGFSNWYINDGYLDFGKYNITYNGKPVLLKWPEEDQKKRKRKNSRKGDTRVKIKMDADWFNKCEWMLIDATDSNEEVKEYLKAGYHVYRDDGAGKPLVEISEISSIPSET